MSADPGSGTPMSERMQALLSRAVEDQLTEQRQVAGVLAEVRGYLAQVTSELEALRTNPPGDTVEIERQVAAVGADVREAIRVLGDRLDAVTGLVHQRGNDLAELRTAVDGELRPRLEALDGALRDMRSSFTGVAARVADLPGRADVESMLERVGDPATELAQRIDRVEGWLENVHDGLFGGEGIQAQLQALAEPPEVEEVVGDDVEEVDVIEAMEDVVARAVADSELRVSAQLNQAVASAIAESEQRVAAHVDEAVLALAEAMLRRKPPRPNTPLTSPLVTPPPAPAKAIDLAPHESLDVEATVGEETGYEPVYEPASVGGGIDEADEDYDDDDDARRRRPWWKPGD